MECFRNNFIIYVFKVILVFICTSITFSYGVKFSQQFLLSHTFPHRVSDDIDMNPCKSGGFMGDIAVPDVKYDEEWRIEKMNKSFLEEVEKVRREVLLEGLQVEEEGMNPYFKKGPERMSHIRRQGHWIKPTKIPQKTSKEPPGSVQNVKILKEFSATITTAPKIISRTTNTSPKILKSNYSSERNPNFQRIGKTIEIPLILSSQSNTMKPNQDLTPLTSKPKRRDKRRAQVRRREGWLAGDSGEIRESLTVYQKFLRRISTRTKRAATARKERVWDHGVIPYEIDGNFSGLHKALFKQAMRHWENFTCVKFVERIPTEHPNYIVFTERPCGCCSFVGKRGNGPQAISIGKNCDKFGIVVHELGHVVGFWHEHTRPDRDNHVLIERENIMSGQEYNFNKLTEEEVNSQGLPYDYDSIMHYARNTFSKGTYLDTISPTEQLGRGKRRPEIGQRVRLSEGDIAQTNLLYKCPRCGRTFQENSGKITSGSGEMERCEWRITATHGERIVLNITDLDIAKSESCRSNYLEVRDGYWHKSTLLGRFCGSGHISDLIVSSGSRMLLQFVTSPKQSGHKGFTAYFEAVCGGNIFVNESGHLESPNFPEYYQASKECIWKLTAPTDYQVAIKFHSFEVENHDTCLYDYVEIRDGHSSESRLIGKYCGYKLPPDLYSTGNKLMIKFVSDSSVQKAGFSAAFMKEYDECSRSEHGCEHHCINTLGGYECACQIGFELHSDSRHCEDACGGVIDVSNGTLTSPSFPDLYPGNKNCVWEIIAPPLHRITLNFTHFDLEGNNVFQQECEYDSVEVHSKLQGELLNKHGVYCGSRIPPPITSEGNTLRIEFNSDSSIHKSGFAALFFTDKDECAVNNGGCQHECRNTIGSYTCSCHNGFSLHSNGHDCKEGGCRYELRAPLGNISSPNYPEHYPRRKDCIWHFTTTPGHRIKLMFSQFELESHHECAYDHVALYDGDSADSRTLGRFCGSKLPHPIIATTNEMFMVFKSDGSVQRKGFMATHTTVCGGHLKASTTRVKHLYSHSKYGDHNYEDRADCDWTIEAEDPGHNVHLTFLTFEVEDQPDCTYDYVEVFSGLDASGPSYGKFCGNSNPTDIISVNEALLVRFRSDDTIVSKGFSASYIAVDPATTKDEMNAKTQE